MSELIETLQNWLNAFESLGVWSDIITAIIIFLFFLAARGLFAGFIFNLIIKATRIARTELGTSIMLAYFNPLKALIFVIGLYFALLALPLAEQHYIFLYPIYRSMFIFFIAWGLYNITDCTIFRGLSKKYALDQILVDFIVRVLRGVVIVLTVITILQTWGYNVEGFLAGIGLGGLAFALAAQDTAANIFGGIMIIADKPFSVGDWIETPSVEGTVEEMTFRSTKVRTFAHALVTVPNSVIANQALTNWTRMGKRRITFTLGVTYSTPIEKLQSTTEKIRKMLEDHPEIHKELIFVRFDRFSESSLDIFLYFFTHTTSWAKYLEVKEDVNFRIMGILAEEGVSIAFPSQSIYFRNSLKTE